MSATSYISVSLPVLKSPTTTTTYLTPDEIKAYQQFCHFGLAYYQLPEKAIPLVTNLGQQYKHFFDQSLDYQALIDSTHSINTDGRKELALPANQPFPLIDPPDSELTIQLASYYREIVTTCLYRVLQVTDTTDLYGAFLGQLSAGMYRGYHFSQPLLECPSGNVLFQSSKIRSSARLPMDGLMSIWNCPTNHYCLYRGTRQFPNPESKMSYSWWDWSLVTPDKNQVLLQLNPNLIDQLNAVRPDSCRSAFFLPRLSTTHSPLGPIFSYQS